MKNSITFALALFVFTASWAQKGPLKGSGKVVQREFSNVGFDKISFEDFDGKIEVEVGKPFGIHVAIDSNLEPLLFVNQEENILRIGLESNKNGRLYLEDTHIKITVSMPEASVISHRGNTNLHIKGIAGRYFRLEHHGNGGVSVNGFVDELDIKKEGNGNVDARKLSCKTAKVRNLGNGNVSVYSQISLFATGAGNGSVMQFGPGKIDALSGIVGNGDVRKM